MTHLSRINANEKLGFSMSLWEFLHAFKLKITIHFPRINSNKKLGFSMKFWAFLHAWKWKMMTLFFKDECQWKTGILHKVLSVFSNAEVSSCMKMKNHDKFSKDKFLQKKLGFSMKFLQMQKFWQHQFWSLLVLH